MTTQTLSDFLRSNLSNFPKDMDPAKLTDSEKCAICIAAGVPCEIEWNKDGSGVLKTAVPCNVINRGNGLEVICAGSI